MSTASINRSQSIISLHNQKIPVAHESYHKDNELKLEPLIAENIHLVESVASRKKVKINCYVPPNAEVIADENILRLALRNAVSNAIKFSTPDKSIDITVEEKEDKLMQKIRYMDKLVDDLAKGKAVEKILGK